MPTVTDVYEEDLSPPAQALPVHYHEVQYLFENCVHRLSLAKNKKEAEFALRLSIPFLLQDVFSQLNPVEQQELQQRIASIEEQFGDPKDGFDYLVKEVISYV